MSAHPWSLGINGQYPWYIVEKKMNTKVRAMLRCFPGSTQGAPTLLLGGGITIDYAWGLERGGGGRWYRRQTTAQRQGNLIAGETWDLYWFNVWLTEKKYSNHWTFIFSKGMPWWQWSDGEKKMKLMGTPNKQCSFEANMWEKKNNNDMVLGSCHGLSLCPANP